MRIVFAGTPEVAVPSLERVAIQNEIVAVITRPDAAIGRKKIITPSPVAAAVERLGVTAPVFKVTKLASDVTAEIAALKPDLGVIVAFGGLVREPLLATPKHGWINLHFSSLPAWRGAAPVQRALIAGETEIGMSVFKLVPELDAGDVYAHKRHPLVDSSITAGELLNQLAIPGAELLAGVVTQIASGVATATPQAGEPTYAAKLNLDDGRITWTESASTVISRYQGTTPEPGTWTTLNSQRIKLVELRPTSAQVDSQLVLVPGEIHAEMGKSSGGLGTSGRVFIGTGTEPVELVSVQPAGKAAMNGADWFRGLPTTSTTIRFS